MTEHISFYRDAPALRSDALRLHKKVQEGTTIKKVLLKSGKPIGLLTIAPLSPDDAVRDTSVSPHAYLLKEGLVTP